MSSGGDDESSSSPRISSQVKVLLVRAVLIAAAGGVTGGLGIIYFKHVLGADAVTLGLLTSVSSLSILVSMLFSGWLCDRYGRKRAFVAGTALACVPPLLFFLASDWVVLFPAYVVSAVGSSLITPSYQYIIRVSTRRSNRSTSIAAVNMASNVVAMTVPPVAALVLMRLGGVPAVRYSFLVSFLLIGAAALYVAKRLRVPEYTESGSGKPSPLEPLRDLVRVYRISRERRLHYWLLFVATGPFVGTVVGPFWSLYAYEVCGTPGELMGLLPTAQALTYALLLMPVSRLSDRVGRKRIYLSLRPFLWLSFATLLVAGTVKSEYSYVAPHIAWALYGVFATSSAPMAASLMEAFPKEYVSRWTSLRNAIYYVVAIPVGYLGGVLWSIDPRLPFAVALTSDLARTLLLLKVPETHIAHERAHAKPPRHIVVYELPGAGLSAVVRLLRDRLGFHVVEEADEEELREVMRRREPSVISGEAGLRVAREDGALVVLLVAPRYERAKRVMRERGEPLFVAYRELEEEDRKVSKAVKRYFKADLEHLPPFDVAINMQRIPPDVAEKIIEVAYIGSRRRRRRAKKR